MVLVRTRGMWARPSAMPCAIRDTLRGLAMVALRLAINLIFLMPRREISIHFEEAAGLPATPASPRSTNILRNGSIVNRKKAALCPTTFGRAAVPVPLPSVRRARASQRDAGGVDAGLRKRVHALVAEQAVAPVHAEDLLGRMRPWQGPGH